MKKELLLLVICTFVGTKTYGQVYAPIAATGYTLDAVAENTTALATTSGALDGSDFVLYSAAYGSIYSIVGGLPNSGLITSGTYSYQLEPYTQNNVLFIPITQTDSLTFTTPSSYASLSLLAFATEGTASMSVTLRFTDNTTQVFSPLSLNDWFGGTTSIVSGFGRAGRTSGTIVNPAGQPKMFNVDLNLSCANRLKSVLRVIVHNNSANARICVMAVSGAGMPTYTATSSPVSCAGGTNGTCSLSISNSLPPNTYTWNTTPTQFGAQAVNLSSGLYSYTVTDGAGCLQSSTVAVGISTTTLPSLLVGSSATLVCPGALVTLSTFGALTYTWSNNLNSPVTTVNPLSNSSFSVIGTTAANCQVSGSIAIQVHPTTSVSFNSLLPSFCVNSTSSQLTASPVGGLFSGTGVSSGVFFPNLAGAGVFTLSYFYTDANNCSYTATATTTVSALPTLSFTISPNQVCLNGANMSLLANPSGGVFNGPGVIGSVLSPSLAGSGAASVVYSYTDANTCQSSVTATVLINSLPVISFTPIATSMCVNAATIQLNATPAGGSFSGTGVNGSAFSPSIAGSGIRTITYAYTNTATSCSSTKTISTTVSACTGIENITGNDDKAFMVYPNPANTVAYILSEVEAELTVSNKLGQCLHTYNLNADNTFALQLSNMPPGIYFLMFTHTKGVVKKKLIVQ